MYKAITTTDPVDEIQSNLVDVRDVAQSHLLAYEVPKASNQRYIISGHTFGYQEVLSRIFIYNSALTFI